MPSVSPQKSALTDHAVHVGFGDVKLRKIEQGLARPRPAKGIEVGDEMTQVTKRVDHLVEAHRVGIAPALNDFPPAASNPEKRRRHSRQQNQGPV